MFLALSVLFELNEDHFFVKFIYNVNRVLMPTNFKPQVLHSIQCNLDKVKKLDCTWDVYRDAGDVSKRSGIRNWDLKDALCALAINCWSLSDSWHTVKNPVAIAFLKLHQILGFKVFNHASKADTCQIWIVTCFMEHTLIHILAESSIQVKVEFEIVLEFLRLKIFLFLW